MVNFRRKLITEMIKTHQKLKVIYSKLQISNNEKKNTILNLSTTFKTHYETKITVGSTSLQWQQQ